MSEPDQEKKKGLQDILAGAVKGASDAVAGAVRDASGAVAGAAGKAGELLNQGKDAIVHALDANGNGEIDLEEYITLGMNVPGVRIDRAAFLQAEFRKYVSQETIDKAVAETPAHAGIALETVD